MRFYIPGEPVGKGRPRVVRNGGFSRTYTPEKTVVYENLVKVEFQRQCPGMFIDAGIPVSISLKIYQQPAKSDSMKRRQAKLDGKIRPMKKPDCSNVLKSIEDALNSVAYVDDSQIVSVTVEKWYALQPGVDVEIAEVIE